MRFKFAVRFLSLAFASICLALGTQSAHAARVQDDQVDALRDLFRADVPAPALPARHTFVFWLNGDADHFVTATASSGDPSSKVFRGDKFDEQALERAAEGCTACNVVILHDQRGRAHWYTANKPWATYVRIYSRGRKLEERHVDEIDESDPRVLEGLMRLSEATFPGSERHLIYRGHSFRATYAPGSKLIAPFDYSYAGQGYGEAVFINSLNRAGYGQAGRAPLASLTLASCSMASWELANRITRATRSYPTPIAQYLVASEIDVQETLDVGFRFDSIRQVTDAMDNRQVSYLLASRMLEAFKQTPVLDDAMMEAPSTWVDLAGMAELRGRWQSLVSAINALDPVIRKRFFSSAQEKAGLAKDISERYLRSMVEQPEPGDKPLSAGGAQMLAQSMRMPSLVPGDLDLGQLLDLVASSEATRPLADMAHELKQRLQEYVFVVDRPALSPKLGMSVTLIQDENGSLTLPR